MRRLLAVALACLVPLIAGCDTDRMNDLEKQNKDLKAQLDKQHTTENYELQSRCSNDARAWFNGNWAQTSRDKDTMLLDHQNHYDAKQNKCFIFVEYHFKTQSAGPKEDSWINDMTLYDVLENSKYGEFSESHLTYFDSQLSSRDILISCEVYGEKCKTVDEFNNLMRPYMND